MLNTISDEDLEVHQGRSTQDNSSKILQTLVDVEACMMSSKIAHILKSLLKNKQSNCGQTKLVVYTQWTQFLNLWVNSNMQPLPIESILPSLYGRVGIALAHHPILSAQIDGTITAQAQEKALADFFNNPECEVLIASSAAAGAGLNITCANMVYLMVRGPPKLYCDFWTLTSTFPGAQLEPSH
ncbi:hypothetical protein O181_066846 [Austropuccinia psidii MF-1]|uniref:Helicase C-terminal domain-containing protein n=1 Tax=Austropuccinia psidii MF-1 TaxID=1389203 RepID=A0A9Q3ERP9_9BASI|nr:hypothetical protein [Austropuccinia psidii MF-1]